LREFFKVHKDVKIAIFPYDIINLEEPKDCKEFAEGVFGKKTTLEINELYTEFGETIKNTTSNYSNVRFVEKMWGSLQRDGGIPNPPNLNFPSPKKYFSDCIHPNSLGWNVLNDQFFNDYWKYVL
jgi:hypothetical protein